MEQRIIYGYAQKTSKDKEATEQLTALHEAGISPENIFVDQPGEKEMFQQLTDGIQAGDMLVLKSLVQLGYSYHEILDKWKTLTQELGAHIRVLNIELLDTSVKRTQVDGSFISDFCSQILSFAARREREYIKQRQAEGIAYARSQGKHLGRPRIPKPLKFDEVYDRWRSGGISAVEAMTQMNLKRSTFERFVKERKEILRKESEEKAS